MTPPPPRVLYFVRHGQSQANAGAVTQAHADIPLTELGRRQAEALAPLLPPDPARVLCSPFLRARQTARPYCAKREISPGDCPLLREFETIDPDLIAGMTGEQRRPVVDAYWNEADPCKRMGAQAETFVEFSGRVQDFMETELPRLPNATVLFGHGMWIGMMAWKLLGFGSTGSSEMRGFRRFQLGLPMPNGALYELRELSPRQWGLRVDARAMRILLAVR
ncbi:MAG: histidine phosphatase family protein [Candidatus Accumulibacter sp.]|jgi:broad specificity phosphatase PhoE|nr:histidine phosphatase family protein [Accumulibacter sp.]